MVTAISTLVASQTFAAQVICGQNTVNLGTKGKNVAVALNNLNNQLKLVSGPVSSITISYDDASDFAVACVSTQ